MRRLVWPLREDACLFAEALRTAPERTELERPGFDKARRPIVDADSDFNDLTLALARRLLLALCGLRATFESLFFFVEEVPDIFIPEDFDDDDADLDVLRPLLRLLALRLLSDAILSGIKPPFLTEFTHMTTIRPSLRDYLTKIFVFL
jgi:hypothetical protein